MTLIGTNNGDPLQNSRRGAFVETAVVAAILLVAALVAVAPHLLFGFPLGHSANVNIFWYECFNEQLRAGELIPRWLYDYWDGLGAPVFYFYAPLPFYLFSLVDLLPIDPWGDLAVLSVGHALQFFLSGAAFYVLVRPHTDRFWAVATAIGYMLAPYHYIDLEVRAAIGESAAYIWVPLTLAGVWRTNKTWWTTVLAASAYAGLVLSHLPSALLAAPAIALCAVLSSDPSERPRALGHSVAIGVLGVALSAFYVVPALTLRDTLPHDPWITAQGSNYVATKWLLGNLWLLRFGGMVYALLGATSILGVGLLLIHARAGRRRPGTQCAEPGRRHTIAILGVLLMCWFLMSGLSWPLWKYVPFLYAVQFPWRLGVVVEVCSFVLIALYAPAALRSALSSLVVEGRRREVLERVVASTVLVVVAVSLMAGLFPPAVRARSDIHPAPAPVEYRTKWLVESPVYLGSRAAEDLHDIEVAPGAHNEGVARWKEFVTPRPSVESLRTLGRDETVSIQTDSVTRTTIFAVVDSPTTLRVKKVYYPHWRLTSSSGEDLEVRPDEQTGLLTFDVPRGEHELRLSRRVLREERVGMLVSLLASVATLIGLLLARPRRRSAPR